MKSTSIQLFILSIIIFLSGCVPSSPQNTRKSVSSSVKNSSSGTNTNPTFTSSTDVYWYTSEKVDGTITVNKNLESVIYLRGKMIHDFLISKDSSGLAFYQNGKSYCLIGNQIGTFKQVRLRAVPISINNISTNSLERLFRIDIPSPTENSATCGVATTIDGSTAAVIDGKTNAQAAYSLPEICTLPACTSSGYATTSTLKLYISNTSALSMNIVDSTKVSLSSLNLRVDLQSNSNSSSSACTNSACEAKGFDCCIEGQCADDATIKTNAKASYPTEYIQAIEEYKKNPLNFLNYPNIFNICANIAHNPPALPVETPTPVSDAQTRVNQYLADYTCINNFATTSSYSSCSPTSEQGYKDTKKKLAVACGCPSSYSYDETQAKCPDWGVKPVYKSTVQTIANIIDFYCYTPVVENPIGPITNLNVAVPSRSAPHRFFAESTTITTQEGTEFFYQDNLGKTSPENGSFNINSILGTMKLDLSQTNPAKTVNVELGKTYIVSATSGYFTPCSTCAKDSWYQSFTAHPATIGGSGLRATGYTTARDNYNFNTSLANYEDTKFGRACYVPVTMIPLSHKRETETKTQRQNRLTTQSAYYVNGYQKDWYGFNKGALIGSFDGVSWFAVGSGRRITATSTKLFLAINGAFLDLADRTDTIVNIIPDIASNIAADYDFDPTIAINDPKQNTAGTCQQYHQCSTDTDCVTQLGWEYVCADVSQMRTKWPVYDTDGNELRNQESTGTIFEILQATTTQGDSTRRCVYRGSGAPCLRNFTTQDGKFNQKVLTCAPNFYCASINDNRFNDQIARSPNEYDDVLFGMDANVLGRPLNYVTANNNLTDTIRTNIKYNGGLTTLGLDASEVEDMGMCQPGRSLSSNAEMAHSFPDTSKRTDYISQIGSCNSQTVGSPRTQSCPVIGEDLNHLPYDSIDPDPLRLKQLQNSCGAESKHNSTLVSAFKNIEGLSLQSSQNIVQPTLVQDACYRRAGSVCFTDLDCSPNKMHEESVGSISLAFFGLTEAEQSYWKESLVCSQGKAVPTIGSTNYYDYKLNENRCCREIGKDFTMYTSGPSNIITENMGSNVNLDTSLLSSSNPSANYRYSRYSVSKIAQEEFALGNDIYPMINATVEPAADQWKVINETGNKTCCGGGWIRKFADGTNDWKVKNRLNVNVNNFSCLNYRSPLADPNFNGFTTDFINQTSFQREYDLFCKYPGHNGCIQIPHPLENILGYGIIPPRTYDPALVVASDDGVTPGGWETTDPMYAGAPAYNSQPATNHTRLDTSPMQVGAATPDAITCGMHGFNLNADVPYQAQPYSHSPLLIDLMTCDDGSRRTINYFYDKDLDYGNSIYLPAYIPYNQTTGLGQEAATNVVLPTVSAIYIKYYYEDGRIEVANITNRRVVDKALCDQIVTNPSIAVGHAVDRMMTAPDPVNPANPLNQKYERWCISANAKTQNRPVLHIKAFTGSVSPADDTRQWKYASVVVEFRPLEKYKTTNVAIPGNPYYYLTKLGRLELIGVPQITYEPIYCNSDQDKLVPGIFNFAASVNRDNIHLNTNMYNNFSPISDYDEEGSSEADSTVDFGNTASSTSPLAPIDQVKPRFTYRDKLAHPAIFSSKDFKCCTPLGKETTAPTKCCSNNAATIGGKMYCKLPTGTDLNVYFNKFISSEGVGEDEPNGGLLLENTDEEESDFNPYTGEPKLKTSTYQKLEALGVKHCQSGKIGNGGAFALFPPEPYSGYASFDGASTITYPLSIVDSILDWANEGLAGKSAFDNGYRWDHHIYCK
jgi:hypothetical protein